MKPFIMPEFRPIPLKTGGLSENEIKLDGVWKLNPSPQEGFQTKAIENGWKDFIVPGQWLQQGFDIPKEQGVGVSAEFEIPASWAGKRIFLRFDAVHAGTDYWLNGKHLGYSENLATPVEFDVTEAALVGAKNRLAMKMVVDTPSETASWMSGYALHSLGGIPRSVRLFALPQVHIARLHYTTEPDDEYKIFTLALDLKVSGRASVKIVLEDASGKQIPLENSEFDAEGEIKKSFSLESPVWWSDEKPYLYRLKAALYQSGELLEEVERNVGFRNVEVRGRRLFVNGKPVRLRGVNRHEIDPLTGRAATAVYAEDDVRLFREANFNFIRTSHYPPTREFLDACDRLGMFVEVEAPFCWATSEEKGVNNPDLVNVFLDPSAAMVEYDMDHPSVIIWSLANESGAREKDENRLPANFAASLEICRKLDPTRPIIFNNEWNRDEGRCDISALHYPNLPLDDIPDAAGDTRPVLIDEFFPPMSWANLLIDKLDPGIRVEWSFGQNSPDSLWNTVWGCPYALGASIWAGIDEEFYFSDGSLGGYGSWGFIDGWRRKKCEWWDAKLIHSPVWISVRSADFTPGKPVRIPVENRYSFTDLSELRCEYEIGSFQGSIEVVLPPQSKGEMEIPVLAGTEKGSLLKISFFDKAGTMVTAHGVTLGNIEPAKPSKPSAGCPEFADEGGKITITGNSFRMVVDKSTGEILPGSTVKLRRLPTFHIARRGEKHAHNPNLPDYAEYPDAGSRVIDSITAGNRDGALVLRVEDKYTDFAGSTELSIDAEGNCEASFDYVYTGEPFAVKEFGLRFEMDGSCDTISWRRRSEWDVYPDDHIGRPEGTASALPPGDLPFPPYLEKPAWPWHLDANEYGTRDFRATKFGIYEASLLAADGSGIEALSDGSVNVRAQAAGDSVLFHILDGRASVRTPLSAAEYRETFVVFPKPTFNLGTGGRVSGRFFLKLDMKAYRG